MKFAKIAILTLLCASLGCSGFKRWAYEGYDRDAWQRPERVVEELAIEPGARVADVGAGGGYFTFRLAEAVGPGGRLFAVDVDEDMTGYLDERVAADGAVNVTVILGRFEDPLLPDGEIDLVFTCNTFHHIQDRVAYFARLRQDLAPGGRVAILELNDHSWFPRTFGHYTAPDVILREMAEAGYTLDRQLDFIDRQSFSIFRATPQLDTCATGRYDSGMTPHGHFQNAANAARPVVYPCTGPAFESETSRYLHSFDPTRMDETCNDPGTGATLWDRSVALCTEIGARPD